MASTVLLTPLMLTRRCRRTRLAGGRPRPLLLLHAVQLLLALLHHLLHRLFGLGVVVIVGLLGFWRRRRWVGTIDSGALDAGIVVVAVGLVGAHHEILCARRHRLDADHSGNAAGQGH